VGETRLTPTTQTQIAKDALLRGSPGIDNVEWVFRPSPITGRFEPNPVLQNALSRAGIGWSLDFGGFP
jgi:hypothetical protein